MFPWEAVKRRAVRVKSPLDLQSSNGATTTTNNSNNLEKVLSIVDLTFLGLGSIVGAGVYVLSGVTASSVAGPSVVLSFLFAALAALFAALCYAEFAVELPITGGAFNYISVTFGEAAAWSTAWNMILETLLSSAAVSRGFSGYLATLLGMDAASLIIRPSVSFIPIEIDFLASGLIALLTVVLCRGTKQSSVFNIAVCSINLSCIAFIVLVGMPHARLDNVSSHDFFPFGIKGTFAAASIVFFAFVGFDYIANAAEEAADSRRGLPISILASLGIATCLYVLMSAVLVFLVPYYDVDVHAPFSAAFAARGIGWAAKVISFGALAGIITSTMTGLLSQARLFVVLGRERLLPARLAIVHPSTGVPLSATILTGSLAAFLALFLNINILAELVSVGTLYVFYCVCAGAYYYRLHIPGGYANTTFAVPALKRIGLLTLASVILSVTYTNFDTIPVVFMILLVCFWCFAAIYMLTIRPIRTPARFVVPLFPATSILGITCTIHLLCSLGWPAYVRFVVWMIIGGVVYVFYGVKTADRYDEQGGGGNGFASLQQHRNKYTLVDNGLEEIQLIEQYKNKRLSSLDHERPLR